jgi:hypothetical protein
LHTSATVSKIWDTAMGWAMEPVKRFGAGTSWKNITGDPEECRRITLRWVLCIRAMTMGGGLTRSAVVFSDVFSISSRVLLSRNALLYFAIIRKLGPYSDRYLSSTFRAPTNLLQTIPII